MDYDIALPEALTPVCMDRYVKDITKEDKIIFRALLPDVSKINVKTALKPVNLRPYSFCID